MVIQIENWCLGLGSEIEIGDLHLALELGSRIEISTYKFRSLMKIWYYVLMLKKFYLWNFFLEFIVGFFHC